MNQNSTERHSGTSKGRSWTQPKLTRLAAGRAELAAGPASDGPNVS
jgi:hypothetical protein